MKLPIFNKSLALFIKLKRHLGWWSANWRNFSKVEAVPAGRQELPPRKTPGVSSLTPGVKESAARATSEVGKRGAFYLKVQNFNLRQTRQKKLVSLLFAFLLLAGVVITLKAIKQGWQFPKAGQDHQTQSSVEQIPVNPPLSYPVFGQVQTKDGQGIPNAQVSVQIKKDQEKSVPLSTTTSKDGRFVLNLGNARRENGASLSLTGYESLAFSFITKDNEKGELKTSLFEATNNQPLNLVIPQAVAVCPEEADLDENGVINARDFSLLIAHYGPVKARTVGDINCDGQVDALDISLLIPLIGK